MIRMKHLTRFVLPLVLVLTVASLAIAQERNRGRFRGGFGRGGFGTPSALNLVQIDKVQTELKLTDEQKSRVNELSQMSREEGRKLFSGLADLSREERRERFAEVREKREKLSKEMDEMLYEALDEAQSKRLKQLVVQRQGINALQNEEVAKKLALTEDQKSKINSTIQERREKMREAFRPGEGFDRSKFEEINKETEQQVLGALNAEQKKQFEEMKGEEFEFPAPERRGRRGRGRRSNDS